MSNHFTGLSLGPPLGDQRLDLCDLYAFQAPADPARTVLILNANPEIGGFHPDAIYRLNIDNDGDYLTDIAFSYVFSPVTDGRQTVSVYLARGAQARSDEVAGTKIISDAEVSFGPEPNIVTAGDDHVLRRGPQRRVLLRLRGHQEPVRHQGGRNFTAPHLGGPSPWTGKGLQHRGQRPVDRDRAAHRRARRPAGHPHLGPVQPAPRRRAACTRTGPATRR